MQEAFTDMYDRLSKEFKVKEYYLRKWFQRVIELIIGLQNDPQFGPVIMIGLGGIYTELFKDISFRVLPITKNDAMDMINDLKGNKILKGFRGSEKIDLEMLSEAIVHIGNLGYDTSQYFDSVDFNPIIVYPNDYFVVDAKIILKQNTTKSISNESPDSSYMDTFFNAKSIALIGASPEEGKIEIRFLKV